MRYTMKNEGFPYKNIYAGRAKVGRVYRRADGKYVGVINGNEFVAATEDAAFRESAARAMGYADLSTLQDHNRRVSRKNRVAKREARALAYEYLNTPTLSGKMAVLDRVFKKAGM
jgi:hypothetical protein